MHKDDKEEYFQSIIKNMITKCHTRCFNLKTTIELNSNCINACYHKYIHSLNILRKETIAIGESCQSEFIETVFKPNSDAVTEFIFPPGGSYSIPAGWMWFTPNKTNFFRQGFSPYRDKLENS